MYINVQIAIDKIFLSRCVHIVDTYVAIPCEQVSSLCTLS